MDSRVIKNRANRVKCKSRSYRANPKQMEQGLDGDGDDVHMILVKNENSKEKINAQDSNHELNVLKIATDIEYFLMDFLKKF